MPNIKILLTRRGENLLPAMHLLDLGALDRLVRCRFIDIVLPLQQDTALNSNTQNQVHTTCSGKS